MLILHLKAIFRVVLKFHLYVVSIILASLFFPIDSSLAQPVCQFTEWKNYQNTKLISHPIEQAYIFSSSHVRLDADGAPNAYHPDDIHLPCRSGEGFKGLECPENAGYPNSGWWHHALVPDPGNPDTAYVQPSGNFEGYFVSKTSLIDESKVTTDTNRYVDATQIPYFVFPRAFYRMSGTGLLGDLGFAVNLSTGESSPFVVADIGPTNAELGEMSLALADNLGGDNPNPRTGAGSPSGDVLYVIFPYSSRTYNWPLTLEEIQANVNILVSKIGGVDMVVACKDEL